MKSAVIAQTNDFEPPSSCRWMLDDAVIPPCPSSNVKNKKKMLKHSLWQFISQIPLFLGDHIRKWQTGETHNNSRDFGGPGKL
jgi:hypothetical protein